MDVVAAQQDTISCPRCATDNRVTWRVSENPSANSRQSALCIQCSAVVASRTCISILAEAVLPEAR